MNQFIKYMIVLFISMTGVFAVASATEAAQIGIGTEQKIVQNPLELERQAMEREAEQKRQREAQLAEEKRRAAEQAKREAEQAKRVAEEKAEREAKQAAEKAAKEAEAARAEKEEAKAQAAPSARPVSTKVATNVLQVESTAYTNDAADNSSYNGRVLTATGHDVTDSIYYNGMRIIAVDPSVIPLGSVVHLEGIGDAIALDTGGRIKGNIVDLLVDTKDEAIQWGRRHIQVTIN